MNIIAKFRVTSMMIVEGTRRKRDPNGNWVKDEKTQGYVQEKCNAGQVKLVPVYANDDAKHENSRLWDATPTGEFNMSVNNLAALDGLVVGDEYYITISPTR